MNLILQILVMVVGAAFLALATAALHPQLPPFDPQELQAGEVNLVMVEEWEAPVLWVDARSWEAYEYGHIPGAVLLNEEDWDFLIPGFLDHWEPEHKIVVYCDSRQCGSSRSVKERIENELGIGPVFILHGGWDVWQSAETKQTEVGQ